MACCIWLVLTCFVTLPPQDDKSKSTLYQMQRMFAYLQDSDRQYYDPVPYAKSLTWEGEPTNVNVMQDASDYVSNMFLHIGRQLQVGVGGWVRFGSPLLSHTCGHPQGTKQEKSVRSLFTGVETSELVAKGHYSTQAPQNFEALSLDVANHSRLEVS